MNYKYSCLNPIAEVGLKNLDERYVRTEKFEEADAVFVRSAKMDELKPGDGLLAVARAGAGVNNIPHAEYAKRGIVVFNTPGANANGVKELVIAAMLIASRDIVGGIGWVRDNASDPAIGKSAEKAKSGAKSKAKKGIKEKADAKKTKPTKPAKPAKKTEKPAKARRRAARAAKKDDLPNNAVWPDPKSKRKK